VSTPPIPPNAAPPAGPAIPGPQFLPLPAQPLSVAKRILVVLLVLMSIGLGVLKALFWSGGVWSAEASGYALGSVMIPLLIAYAIAGRKRSLRPMAFGLTFLGLSSLLLLLEMSHPRKNINEYVADRVREAAGTKPVNQSGAFDSPEDILLRDVLGDILKTSKEYARKRKELSVTDLYAPESFAGPEAIRRTRASVQNITTLDHDFVLQVEQWPDHVGQQVAASSLSERGKKEFVNAFLKSFSNSETLATRRQIDQVEANWCASTLALYDFALAHTAQIHPRNNQIFVGDEPVRKRFNELLRQAQDQQGDMTDLNAKLDKLQEEGLQRFGLNKSDIGVAPSSGAPDR